MSDVERGGFISKVIGPKKRWRAYKARTRELPESYRTAVEALQRYLMYCGPGGDGAEAETMFEDLVDLFEQSAANETPIREIVGEDPVEFLEAFVRNYPDGNWRIRERKRLNRAIARAAGETNGDEGLTG
jgi:DNA-binding ferritin-like protein (Dps family)